MARGCDLRPNPIHIQLHVFSLFSTISSGLNAISAVLLEDFTKPFCCTKLTPHRATLLAKIFGKNTWNIHALTACSFAEARKCILYPQTLSFGNFSSTHDMFTYYKYLIVNLVLRTLAFGVGNSF